MKKQTQFVVFVINRIAHLLIVMCFCGREVNTVQLRLHVQVSWKCEVYCMHVTSHRLPLSDSNFMLDPLM